MTRPGATLILALGAALGASPAAAAWVTSTFGAVGAEQVFTVPGGVRQLAVTVAGAPGGDAFVAPGEVLALAGRLKRVADRPVSRP